MASPFLLSLFSLFILLTLSSSSPDAITILLSPFTQTPHTNPWQKLNHFVSASLSRAHHLKYPKNNASLTKTPLFPRSYGGYSVSLSFGTPPQTLPFVMDTGSSLTWFPCTQRYICSHCSIGNVKTANISTFIPRLSSSVKILGCKNPKCGWLFDADIRSRCQECNEKSGNCTQICPAYLIQYGSGSTSGILLSETLDFPMKVVNDFIVGCSILSTSQPSGIAGFGRGPESLPAQMGLKKFSYCLVSHKFDDAPESSELVLVTGSDSGDAKTAGVSYTPFHKKPSNSNPAFADYYYVTLRKITVGGKHVKIPYSFLEPGVDGNGGTMVDSGSTFTFMDREVHELIAQEFEKQMANYSRVTQVEVQSGLRPCFDVSGKKSVTFPELIFHFKGGAEMQLPIADYFSFLGDTGVVCMTFVTNAGGNPLGPSIIVGNYQQQNFYMEFDLENERLGFLKQNCK